MGDLNLIFYVKIIIVHIAMNIKSAIKKLPFVNSLWNQLKEKKKLELIQMEKDAYQRDFEGTGCYGGFLGLYDCFEEAIEQTPKTKVIGYDNKEILDWYKLQFETHFEKSYCFDYPVLSWLTILNKIEAKSFNIFDFGGNLGNQFYSFEKKIGHVIRRWVVCEVEVLSKCGKNIRDQKNARKLDFITDLNEATNIDIFFASCSLQYVNSIDPCYILNRLPEKPKYLIINRIPLTKGKTVVSLQNGHILYCPQYFYNDQGYWARFQEIGYKLLEKWEDHSAKCIIPHETRLHVPYYYGACFELINT